VRQPDGAGHLTYSMLVHPGDSWEEVWSSLRTYVPKVKERVSPDEPFGVCLRLSAAAATTLAADAQARAQLREFLDAGDLYVYTVNAFPYGPFKGQRVKEQVYEPDWRSAERVRYTLDVAGILAEIAPEGSTPRSRRRRSASSPTSPALRWSPPTPPTCWASPPSSWRWSDAPGGR
jgi:hypothetical protein